MCKDKLMLKAICLKMLNKSVTTVFLPVFLSSVLLAMKEILLFEIIFFQMKTFNYR